MENISLNIALELSLSLNLSLNFSFLSKLFYSLFISFYNVKESFVYLLISKMTKFDPVLAETI